MILKRIFGIALGLISSMPIVYATDCELHVAVAAISQGDKVDKQVENQLQMRLTRAAAAAGLAGDAKSSRFFIAGPKDILYGFFRIERRGSLRAAGISKRYEPTERSKFDVQKICGERQGGDHSIL